MAKKSNKAIILIGVLGGILLVVTLLIYMLMSVFADFSTPEESDKKVQFSVVQRSENVQQEREVKTLEAANAAYEDGERRMEVAVAAAEAERQNSLSSTSFGGGAFRAVSVKAEEEANPEPKPEPEAKGGAAVQQPKPKPKPKPQPDAAASEQPAQVEPQAQAPRKKRTSFDDEPEAGQAQQAAASGSVKFRARVHEDVEIINSSNVRIRVLEDFTYNGCMVKRNTLLPAIAQRGSNAVLVSVQSIVICGNRLSVNFLGYSLNGTLGLPVREDNAAEVGAREGGNAMVSGAANSVATRATGVLGIVGGAVASGVSSGSRASQQAKPVLLEEGRELLFIGS